MAARAPVTKHSRAPLVGAPFSLIAIKGSDVLIVTIHVTREGTRPGADSVTVDEKAQFITGVSQRLLDVLN